MSEALTLYTNPMSRGRIARWMLEEVGAPYQVRYVDFRHGDKPAELLAINPLGKVPTLVHGDAVVTETAAVCAYLATTFPEAGLGMPADPRGRADYLRWMFFAAGPVEAAVTAKALGLLAPADKRGMVGYGSFDEMIDALEAAVSAARPWIAGDRFSAADVYVGSHLAFGLQFGTIPARAVFQDYVERGQARDAHKRACALDDAEMPALGED